MTYKLELFLILQKKKAQKYKIIQELCLFIYLFFMVYLY